jgi:hypothetical protein
MMGASSLRLGGRLWGAGAAALLCLSVGLIVSTEPAEADKVGVAAAVNPDAFSSLSGAPKSQINIGKSIFFSERINTTTSGLVQVLLVDGSTFTVGPGSDLVIDKFVYDPKKQSGEVVASFSKGVMRFVGGKISKNEQGVTVKTPAGALAIRGGMAQGNGKVWSFLFGTAMTFKANSGKTYTVYEPGYTLDLTSGTPTIRPTRPEDITVVMAALTNGSTSGLGSSNDQNGPSNPVDTQGLNQTETDIVNDATQTQIQDTVQDQQNQQQTVDNTPPLCTGPDCGPPPPPPPPPEPVPVKVRVLSSPGVYTAFPNLEELTYTTDTGSGILGGGNYGESPPEGPRGDDFIATFGVLNGRMFGTVTGLLDANCTDETCSEPIETQVVLDAQVDFPWFEANQTDGEGGACNNGFCAVTDAKVVQDGVTTNLVGIAVAKPGFFAYQVRPGTWATGETGPILVPAETDNDPLMVFGGDGYSFDTASGKVYTFQLTQDISQPGAFGPFASDASSPTTAGNGYVSPLVLLEKDSAEVDPNGQSRSVWLQTSFFVGTDSNKPETFINVALGEWHPVTGVSGMRRGGSMVSEDQDGNSVPQTYSFTGDIASLAGPNNDGALSHFMGSDNPNLVIGFDSTGTHNIGRDNPLNPPAGSSIENQSGATYHIGVGGPPIEEPLDQNTDVLHGYAAGLAQQAGSNRVTPLVNMSPSDVTLSLNAAANTMTASFNVGEVDLSLPAIIAAFAKQDPNQLLNPRYKLEFGGQGRSAFIDDNIFAAVEAASGSSVSEKYTEIGRGRFGIPIIQIKTYVDNNPDVRSYIVSADAIDANEVLFPKTNPQNPEEVQKKAFCQECAFLQWGAWGTRVTSDDHAGRSTTKDVQLGWWITGKIPNAGELPTEGSATYEGDAIGNVNNNGEQYVATGDLDMSWDFRKRSGLLTISDFDDRSFKGTMFAPGKVQFGGALTGSGLVGAATGSFVANGDNPAGGVMGNFGVIGNHYQATGIFGGAQTSFTPPGSIASFGD